MRLHELSEGQRFVLARTGKKFEHHGRHPTKKYLVLTAPYSPIPIECKTLHIACEVKPIITVKLSDSHLVQRKPVSLCNQIGRVAQ